jgi:quinoprotein relay system zinc metallohydrolase 1
MNMLKLGILVVAFIGAQSITAQPLDYHLTANKVAADTYVIEGKSETFSLENGGNIVNTGFIVTTSGVVVFDTGPSRRYGQAQRKVIESVTDQPVVLILISHHHPDHFLGTQAYPEVPTFALEGTLANIKADGDVLAEGLYRLVGDWMRGTEVRIPEPIAPGVRSLGGHKLHLLKMTGHSGADLALYDETSGVLFAGDLVFYQRAATTPHANIKRWQQDLRRIASLGAQVIVPGHGHTSLGAVAVAQTAAYLAWLDVSLGAAAARGLNHNEAMDLYVLGAFPELAMGTFEVERSVVHLYREYEKQAYIPSH